jgi:hypothetical protein
MNVRRFIVENCLCILLVGATLGGMACGNDDTMSPTSGTGGAGGAGGAGGPADASADLAGDGARDVAALDSAIEGASDGADGAAGNGASDALDVVPRDSDSGAGAVNGPGCGGCFADEVPSGAHCFADLSCGSPRHTVMTRVNGACHIQSCHPGWGDCDGRADSGCETDFTRPDNCNACGIKCAAGQLCGATGCVTACPPPTKDCGGGCVDVSSSADHCSDCFLPCRELQWYRPTCAAGVCGQEKTCPSNATACGNACSFLDEDPVNCGMCGQRCAPPLGGTVSCRGSVCIPHCPADFVLCGDACVDVQSDPAHCGMCGRACAMGGCVAGACDPSWSPVVSKGTAPIALAVDGASVYWLESDAGTVMKAPKGGGAAVALATGQAAPFDLALDASNVYWSNRRGNAVMRVAKAGGTPELMAPVVEPMHIVTDGVSVFVAQPPMAVDAGVRSAASPGDQIPPPAVRKIRIGSGMAEAYWEFPNGETDCTLGRMLVDDQNFYWAGRRRTVPGTYFLFLSEKETGLTQRAFATDWGELAMDENFLYSVSGPGKAGAPLTIAALGKRNGKGSGLMQFMPDGAYDGGGFMAAGETYLYRSSSGEFAGVHKFLKCGLQNLPVNLTGPDRWSYLVADGPYVYGIFGTDIRRVHR